MTVLGAILLLEYQRDQARVASRQVMKELLNQLLETAEAVRDPKPLGEVEDYVPAIMQMTNADTLKERIAAVKLARTWFTPDTPGMARAFAQIENLDIDRDAIKAELRPNVFYSGVADVDKHLGLFESRVRLILAELDL